MQIDVVNQRFVGSNYLKSRVSRQPGNIGARAAFTGQPTEVDLADGVTRTIRSMIALEAPFEAIQFVVQSKSTSEVTYGPFAVAVGSDAANVNGAGLTWIPVTFSGNATVTLAAAETDAGAGSVQDPVYAVSDFIDISSIARSDDGYFPLVYTAMCIPAGGKYTTQANYTLPTGLEAEPTGRIWYATQQDVDGVTDPDAFTSTASVVSYAVAGVRFRTKNNQPIITHFSCGDSITQYLNGTLVDVRGFTAVKALSTPIRPMTYWNCGWAGQTVEQYSRRASRILPLIQPTIFEHSPYSPNGTPGWTDVLYNLPSELATMRELCKSLGIMEIYTTALPDDNFSETIDRSRRYFNGYIRGLQDCLIPDYSNLIGTGAKPARYKDEYHTDGIHPNSQGQSDMGNLALAPQLERIRDTTLQYETDWDV